jgi:hypothetical protein
MVCSIVSAESQQTKGLNDPVNLTGREKSKYEKKRFTKKVAQNAQGSKGVP